MAERLGKERDKLKRICDDNDEQLDKASGGDILRLQRRVELLTDAHATLADAINTLYRI